MSENTRVYLTKEELAEMLRVMPEIQKAIAENKPMDFIEHGMRIVRSRLSIHDQVPALNGWNEALRDLFHITDFEAFYQGLPEDFIGEWKRTKKGNKLFHIRWALTREQREAYKATKSAVSSLYSNSSPKASTEPVKVVSVAPSKTADDDVILNKETALTLASGILPVAEAKKLVNTLAKLPSHMLTVGMVSRSAIARKDELNK